MTPRCAVPLLRNWAISDDEMKLTSTFGQAGDLALVAARRARLRHRQPGLRQHVGALLHEAALGRQGEDELGSHGAAPLSTASSRSVWIDEPTAGTAVAAPTSATRLS